jgi:hypothetical protein
MLAIGTQGWALLGGVSGVVLLGIIIGIRVKLRKSAR